MLRSKLAMFYLKDLEAANPQRTDAVLESQPAREPAGEASNLGSEEGDHPGHGAWQLSEDGGHLLQPAQKFAL